MYEYKLETHLSTLCEKFPRYTSLNSTWTLNKRACSDLLKSVVMHYPHYSLHDASHSEAVLSKIEMLLGERVEKLSPTDTWLLLHAAYVHDLGMVTQWKEIEEIWDQKEFQNYLDGLKNSSDLEIREAAAFFRNANTEDCIWPLKVSRYVSLINADYFRSKHAQRSKSLLFSEHSDLEVDLGHNQLVQPRLIKLLGEICALHTAPSEKVLELDYQTNGFDSDYAHPRFVAMLLRLGDLLDIDNNRFNRGVELSFGHLPITSIPHKEKHNATAHLLVTPTEICFRSNCPNSESYLEARQFVSWLEDEINFLTIYWAKIVPKDLGGYAPSFDKKELQINGVPDIQGVAGLKFQISQSKAFELIEGSNIYDNPFVCFREVIQNAMDASKIQLWRDLKSGTYSAWIKKMPEQLQPYDIPDEVYRNYPIYVCVSTLPDGQTQVEITDRGTGISVDSFKQMCHVAVSNSSCAQMQEEIHEMVNWLRPTAGFGIGLQSVFLLTDQFEIDTCTGNESYHAVLHSHHTGGHLQLQRASQKSLRGTTIRIRFHSPKYHLHYLLGTSMRNLNVDFDPFSEIDDITEAKVLGTICNHCKVSFFPIYFNCNNLSYCSQKSVSDFPKIVYENDLWKKRYRYQLTPETGRLQLWDIQSASYADFDFKFNMYSTTRVQFKGISIKNTPELELNGIGFSMDIYGMDTKNSITLDRESFTQQGRKVIYYLMQEFKNAFIEIILDKLKSNTINPVNQHSKKERFNPYIFWLICGVKQRENIPEYIISSIAASADVIFKANDNLFKKGTKCVANLLPHIEEQTFCTISSEFAVFDEDTDDDEYSAMCNFFNRSGLKTKQVIVDDTLKEGVKNYWAKTIQIIGDQGINLLYTLSRHEIEAINVDDSTKKDILAEFSDMLVYDIVSTVQSARNAIPAILDYKNLAVDQVPLGIGKAYYLDFFRCNFIISPFVRADEKARQTLSKEQFVERITNAENFHRLVEYVKEHSVTKSDAETIKAEYIRLLKDYYDIMQSKDEFEFDVDFIEPESI